MKYLLLFFVCVSCFATTNAQQSLPIKKWQAVSVIAISGPPAADDLKNQISILEIENKQNNTYSGNIVFGIAPNKTSTSCVIKIDKKNINISANQQQWNGEIFEASKNIMTFKLGSLIYNFRLVPSSTGSGSVSKPSQPEKFYGSWQEISRKNGKGGSALSIGAGDTIYLRFSKDSAMHLPGTDFLPMFGSYDFMEPDKLNIATNDFKVISIGNEEMILDNNMNTISHFVKTNTPFYWEVNKGSVPVEAIDLSPDLLIKNWYVNRIAPAAASEMPNSITSLNIKEKNSENSFAGNISFGKWSENKFTTEPCTLLFDKNQLTIKAASFSWTGQIYKANGDSIKFGQQGLMYYFKKQKVAQPALIETGNNIIDLRTASVLKNWHVYKPEASPGFITGETAILRGLEIKEAASTYKYTGEVRFDKFNTRFTKDCSIEFKTDNENRSWINIISADGNSWNMELFKADGKEMIFGRYPEAIRYNLNVVN